MATSGFYQLSVASKLYEFTPQATKIEVKEQPVESRYLEFNQFTRDLAGVVKCLASCDGTTIALKDKLGKSIENIQTVQDNEINFSASNLNPGEYYIKVVNKNWCFNDGTDFGTVEITRNVPTQNHQFTENNFIIKVNISS